MTQSLLPAHQGPAGALSRADVSAILASRRIDHVVVIGANGAMGYGSGALFTQAVPKVTFLARTKDKAEQGLKAAINQVRSGTVASRVETGGYDEDLPRAVAHADLVFEAVTEDFEVKRQIFDLIEQHRRPDGIVATVTSGLSINALAQGRSASFRRHFAGLHFFNPPNVIVGTELIPGHDTDPALIQFLDVFSTKRLGRVMVRTADRPGFAGNRVGFKLLNECAQLAEEHGPLLVDRLVGPYTGRALTPLATVDLVGWDIHRAIVDNIFQNAPDEAHATLELPPTMKALIAKGVLGAKTRGGFFKTENKVRMVLDPKTQAYVPEAEVKLPDLGYIKDVARLHRDGRYTEAMAAFAKAPGDMARLARKVVAGYISYALHRVGEVTETLAGIDDIMGFGFNWAPPGVLIDVLGPKAALAMIEEAGLPVPEALVQAAGAKTPPRFYTNPHGNIGRFFVAG